MGNSSRPLAVAACAAILTVGAVATAHAQLDPAANPFAAGEQTARENNLDTDQVPNAKPTEMWQLVHGTPYKKTEPVDESVTSFDTDLFTVSFRDEQLGYAGGSRCADPPEREKGESDRDYGQRVSDCSPRVPVLYRFTETAEFGELWEEVELPGQDKPGYIGAIAWIDSERALAVGGDGTYPRREVARGLGESYEDWVERDPAGEGRAWLLDGGSWSELPLSEELEAGMRGMTAVSFHNLMPPELGAAGALGQIWMWEDGEFTELYDRTRAEEEMANAPRFTGRVRDLRFKVRTTGQHSHRWPLAFAVTSSAQGEGGNAIPRFLTFDGRIPRWYVRGWRDPQSPKTPCVGICSDLDDSRDGRDDSVNFAPFVPDSLYSLWIQGQNAPYVSALASPGGPKSDDEPPSVLSGPVQADEEGRVRPIYLYNSDTVGIDDARAVELSTVRLLDTDGSNPTYHSPALPDWSVGELRSTELAGLGAQAVARATHLKREEGIQYGTDENGMPFVEDTDRALHPRRSLFFRLPSYTVNALDVVGESGWGWAVGDRGGLVRLSEVGDPVQAARSEPPAARVGKPRESELTDSAPYRSFRPTAEDVQAGAVPPLVGRPRTQLAEPQFEAAGTLGQGSVSEIVMSRDGSEGWADAGMSGGSPVLHHFYGGEWRRCEATESARGPADRACAGLEGVPAITAMARIPLENDIYPTNDDEFEVFAIAGAASRTTLLRYREGRWEEWEPEGAAGFSQPVRGDTHIAFTAPDDGWMFKQVDQISGLRAWRFDGERWLECPLPASTACSDPEGRLALGENSTGRATDPHDDRVSLSGLALAGERLYAFGHRMTDQDQRYPLILHLDPGGTWRADGGGLDPAWPFTQGEGTPPDTEEWGGQVLSLAITRLADGGFGGWALGFFGTQLQPELPQVGRPLPPDPKSTLMRLEGERWESFPDGPALRDYMLDYNVIDPWIDHKRHLAIPRGDGGLDAFFALRGGFAAGGGGSRIYGFREDAQRFEIVDSGRGHASWGFSTDGAVPAGAVEVMEPDGEGGFWATTGSSFMRYTDRPRAPVFSEVASPVADGRITDLAAARDGSVWLATDQDALYRYDRLTGWDRARIQGWDPGRVVTSPSPVNAIALTPDGEGVAVGPGGRIARLSPTGAVLDAAAGTACDLGAPAPPCTTGRDLRAVAVAPDGSAIAGGDRLALLWRPAGGEFRAIARPQAAAATDIVAVSMPRPDRAWIATSNDRTFRGELTGTDWRWTSEGVDESIRDLALDASGRGYAVGTGGLVLERSGDDGDPWRQVPSGTASSLSGATLPIGGGDGALISGFNGSVLTLAGDRFQVAHHADLPSSPSGGPIVGMALVPGPKAGQSEAWVARSGQLLHYSSDPGDALLRPGDRMEALSDAPAPRAGEITFAALGKSECRLASSATDCVEMAGTTRTEEVITRRSIAEIAARSQAEGNGLFSVFTGDAIDAASTREELMPSLPASTRIGAYRQTAVRGPLKLRRWREMVGDRMERAGVPLLGAVGAQDLSETKACDTVVTGRCASTRSGVRAGENLAWREEMAGRRGPWGEGTDPDLGGEEVLTFSPVRDRAAKVEVEGPTDGAQTHYALDVERDGEAVMRVVFADTSMRSLSASDPQQNPLEPAGQAAWLERVLCREPGSAATGERCIRPAELPAVVVTNTPTYSYATTPPTETMSDAAAFEAILMRHGVSAVVSGRLGWNGRYWALAPGLHEPCPGGDYQDEAPKVGTSICGETGPGAVPVPDPSEAERELAKATGAEVPQTLLPFVVASGAGGELAGAESADEGFWHGYSIVRVPPDGDPRGVIVEQRPILDWVGLTTAQRVIRPRQRVLLRGHGRSPVSTGPNGGADTRASHYEFSSAAVTHRYDLLRADPEEPWLPLNDAEAGSEADGPEACGAYVCLPEHIATIDSQVGRVKAGSGKHPPTYAVAMLSVGEEVATTPLVFEPSPSFRFEAPTAPRPTPAIAAVAAPGSPTAPPTPQIPNVSMPQVPTPPALVPPPPAPPATPPQPPVPPPVPPANAGPSALSLSFAPTGLVVAPTASVIPPPAPPINPAPPGGARKEARQRQAATQKSGADGASEGAEETQSGGGDFAQSEQGPEGSAMTRRAQAFTRHREPAPAQSFTTPARAEQPSAWSRGALYGGGIAIGALSLALAFTTLRPTPRGRTNRPAPAHARAGRSGR